MTHGEIYSSNIISHFIYEAELLIKKIERCPCNPFCILKS